MSDERRKTKAEIEKEIRDAKKAKDELLKEAKKEVIEKHRRKRQARKEYYQTVKDDRTPEQLEHAQKVEAEIAEFIKDKFTYSKFGNVLYPMISWRKRKPGEEDGKPLEYARVVEIERLKVEEYIKPNDSYSNYMADRDPVPEEVIMGGIERILAEYGIDNLDKYLTRKLFYHIILSIAQYLDNYPEFFLELTDLHIYREPLARNVFTVVIPKKAYTERKVSVEGLYNYFVNGGMDLEALTKTLDVYALSYIEYTEAKKELRDKARDSYNRYRVLSELHEQAKANLRKQGIRCGRYYSRALKAEIEKLSQERKLQNVKHINKRYLTDNNVHDIIEEKKEDTEKE